MMSAFIRDCYLCNIILFSYFIYFYLFIFIYDSISAVHQLLINWNLIKAMINIKLPFVVCFDLLYYTTASIVYIWQTNKNIALYTCYTRPSTQAFLNYISIKWAHVLYIFSLFYKWIVWTVIICIEDGLSENIIFMNE